MKFKEYQKIHNDAVTQPVKDACERNGSDYNEYRKKERNIEIISLIASILLLGGVCIGMTACSSKDDKVVKTTTPLITNVHRAVNPTNSLTLNNYSSQNVYYSLYGEYDEVVAPYSVGSMPINGANDRQMVFGSDSNVYYLSDDANFQGYSDEMYSSEEAWNGSYINFYDGLNRDIYLVPQNAVLGSDELTWLLGENINTGVTRNIYKDYAMPTYSVDFTKDYINHYNSFNRVRVEASVKAVEFTYQFSCKVYAVNSSTSVKVLLMSNFNKTNSNPIVNGNNLDLAYNPIYEAPKFYLAPYLASSKLHTNGNFNNSSIVGLRPFVSNDVQTFSRVSLPQPSAGGEDLWDNIGDLIKVTFVSLLPIGDVYILPMVTIGALIFAPLVVLFIMLIIKVLRK